MEMSYQLHVPAVLTSEITFPVPIVKKARWNSQSSGSCEEEKTLILPGIEPEQFIP
jgi:hypothetical protein